MENEIPRRPEYSGLHRNDKLRGVGEGKNLLKRSFSKFLPLFSTT